MSVKHMNCITDSVVTVTEIKTAVVV